jgi:hypothetical protein
MAGARLKERAGTGRSSLPQPRFLTRMSSIAIARGFGWMFAGKPVPGRRALQALMGVKR